MPKFVKIKVNAGGGKNLLHHYLRAGEWAHPAGRIEKGEKPIAAAARELLERTGHSVETKHLKAEGMEDKFHVFSTDKKHLTKVQKPQTEIKVAMSEICNSCGKRVLEKSVLLKNGKMTHRSCGGVIKKAADETSKDMAIGGATGGGAGYLAGKGMTTPLFNRHTKANVDSQTGSDLVTRAQATARKAKGQSVADILSSKLSDSARFHGGGSDYLVHGMSKSPMFREMMMKHVRDYAILHGKNPDQVEQMLVGSVADATRAATAAETVAPEVLSKLPNILGLGGLAGGAAMGMGYGMQQHMRHHPFKAVGHAVHRKFAHLNPLISAGLAALPGGTLWEGIHGATDHAGFGQTAKTTAGALAGPVAAQGLVLGTKHLMNKIKIGEGLVPGPARPSSLGLQTMEKVLARKTLADVMKVRQWPKAAGPIGFSGGAALMAALGAYRHNKKTESVGQKAKHLLKRAGLADKALQAAKAEAPELIDSATALTSKLKPKRNHTLPERVNLRDALERTVRAIGRKTPVPHLED